MFEATFESVKTYADPFNDVAVDVIFSAGEKFWRVPAFWRGGNKWTVRFAPPAPGEYTARLESTDRDNPDLNGHERQVRITAYSGANALLKHGAFRVSANRRYFEHADGTPFYWLGDTWYSGVSDRLPWEGFQTLTADRKAKGFTVVQMAMMTVSNEEDAPSDPGFCNEGGCVWDAQFKAINPRYFDYADRRIQYLVDAGLVPVIFGAWRQTMTQMGVAKLNKHWRYIIARYGAYPVFWVAGGEIYDPPAEQRLPGLPYGAKTFDLSMPGWTEVMRYIRQTDPYHHPLSVHEIDPPYDTPVQDEGLKDFELFQAGHRGWSSVATEIALFNKHYARTTVTKPLVMGEMAWETIGGTQHEDFQRMAFWLGMLNGAAGHSYGNAITGESYSADKPLHRGRHSLMTWEEGLNLPGSYQVGIGAKLLKTYRWQDFVPHPEWVTPRGTTLLEPDTRVTGFDIDLIRALARSPAPDSDALPEGEWKNRQGNFRLPYAAGIPGEVRFIYIPAGQWPASTHPTIQNLEPGVRYRAYFWEPSLGVKFDLGAVAASASDKTIVADDFAKLSFKWTDRSGAVAWRDGQLDMKGSARSIMANVSVSDVIVSTRLSSKSNGALLLRYRDPENYLAAIYSPTEKSIYLREKQNGHEGPALGRTALGEVDANVKLTAEVRNGQAVVVLESGSSSTSSDIVNVEIAAAGKVGLLHLDEGSGQSFDDFEVKRPAPAIANNDLERDLHDAEGRYRGTLGAPGWNDYARRTIVLQKAYRPEPVPFPQDWVLVLAKE